MSGAYDAVIGHLVTLRRFGVRPGLEGMGRLLAALGHPERDLRVIHVAGTNGKGSTAAFLDAILRAGGLSVGLYTSPHLCRFTERIRVNGAEVAREACAALGARVLAAAPEATFFEAATAMAILAFAERGVDVAVLEAGLGGRLDATNVIARPIATAVTGIALDHAEVLGDTLAAIAREKAGIWKPGVPAVAACEDPEARAVLAAEAERIGAPLAIAGRDFVLGPSAGGALAYAGPGGALDGISLGLVGEHQRSNAAVALATAARAWPAIGVGPLTAEARRRGLASARWPGRLERLGDALVLDAAHNPDGAAALLRALPPLAAGRPLALLFGASADKDAAAMLATLAPAFARIVLTRGPSPRAADPAALAQAWARAARGAETGWAHRHEAAVTPEVEPDLPAALARAARPLGREEGGGTGDGPVPLVIAAGSIFLVGAVRAVVTGERCDPPAAQEPAARPLG